MDVETPETRKNSSRPTQRLKKTHRCAKLSNSDSFKQDGGQQPHCDPLATITCLARIGELEQALANLKDAAQEVCKIWDSPPWKTNETPSKAITKLRDAIRYED